MFKVSFTYMKKKDLVLIYYQEVKQHIQKPKCKYVKAIQISKMSLEVTREAFHFSTTLMKILFREGNNSEETCSQKN